MSAYAATIPPMPRQQESVTPRKPPPSNSETHPPGGRRERRVSIVSLVADRSLPADCRTATSFALLSQTHHCTGTPVGLSLMLLPMSGVESERGQFLFLAEVHLDGVAVTLDPTPRWIGEIGSRMKTLDLGNDVGPLPERQG